MIITPISLEDILKIIAAWHGTNSSEYLMVLLEKL